MDWLVLGFWFSLGASLALVALGIVLLRASSRPVSSVSFGVFLLLWGALLVSSNLATLLHGRGNIEAAERLMLLHVAALVVAYVPLVHFASVYPDKDPSIDRRSPRVWALLGPAILGITALLVRPSLFHEGFAGVGIAAVSLWGPLYPPFLLLFLGAFFLALLRLYQAAARAETRVGRRRALQVFAALSIYVAFESVENLVLFRWPFGAPGLVVAAFTLLSLVGVALLAGTLVRVNRSPTWSTGEKRLVTLSILGPGLLGATSAMAPLLLAPWLGPGLRLVSVGLLAWAIVRFEVYDLDLKVKRTAVTAVLAICLAVTAVGSEIALESLLGEQGSALAVAKIGLLSLVVTALFLLPAKAGELADLLPPRLHTDRALDARRLEVYETALARLSGGGGTHEHAGALSELRRSLRITEAEHTLLLRLVEARRDQEGAEPAVLAPGVAVNDRYRLERIVGEGQSGRVFLATDERLDRTVIVKCLNPARSRDLEGAIRAFLTEGRAAARLDHPNVVRVHDFGYAGKVPFLVLEHAEGGSLAELLADRGVLAPPTAARVLSDVLAGLSQLHERRLVHRDLKPANILLGADGSAKISDFGLAQEARADGVGRAQGTPAYMAPEVAEGRSPTAASDLYAVGAIAYQMLTGRTYLDFNTHSASELRRRIVEEPPRIEGLDPALTQVLERALAKEPSRRQASAVELRDELLAALSLMPPEPPVAQDLGVRRVG